MSLVNTLVDKLSDYIKLKAEKLKLDVISQVARLLSHFVLFLVIGFFILFLITFLSLAAVAYLNLILSSVFLGYLIVAGFYLICVIIIGLTMKSGRLQRWLESLFVKLGGDVNEAGDE